MTSYNTVPFNYDDEKKDEAQQGPSTATGKSFERVFSTFFLFEGSAFEDFEKDRQKLNES